MKNVLFILALTLFGSPLAGAQTNGTETTCAGRNGYSAWRCGTCGQTGTIGGSNQTTTTRETRDCPVIGQEIVDVTKNTHQEGFCSTGASCNLTTVSCDPQTGKITVGNQPGQDEIYEVQTIEDFPRIEVVVQACPGRRAGVVRKLRARDVYPPNP